MEVLGELYLGLGFGLDHFKIGMNKKVCEICKDLNFFFKGKIILLIQTCNRSIDPR